MSKPSTNPDPIIGPHQAQLKKRGLRCPKCIAAAMWKHCTWCGEDFPTLEALGEHLDLGCSDAQGKALLAARRAGLIR